ncbi:MAG: pyridoxal-phosphate dependent enzyme [Defluviitaleaceae bacterium]|nr:pyridoxal-phosphate dependent enzyme [Defluviitaleaceae bacterium]
MLFSKIPRIRLLDKETPLTLTKNLGDYLGGQELYFKRDDVMELGMGGNKLRCLEFWLGEAVSQKASTVIVAGLPVSNQCRLTAAACAKLGIKCVIIHNGEKTEVEANRVGNPLLNHILSVETIYCGNVDEYERARFAKDYADNLTKQGEIPYIIGDPVIGALGYVAAALELVSQAERENIDLYDIVISASGGPTSVGLLYGLALFGKSFRVHLISAEYKRDIFDNIMTNIYEGLCKTLDLTPPANPKDISVFYDNYLGEGYAKPTKEAIQASALLAQKEGFFAEVTYNAKALDGMFDLIKSGNICKKRGACFYLTGGTPALFAQGKYFNA